MSSTLDREYAEVGDQETIERLERTWGPPQGLVGALSQVNHRVIGRRFIVTGFVFFLLAGLDGLRIRLQLALPESTLLGPDAYNAAFTMHGTTMMFLFALPILEGIGIYLVPLMIGARDMAFPRLNAFGYWIYLVGGSSLWLAYLVGLPSRGGWFAYPPLTRREFEVDAGVDIWVTMVTFIEIAALIAAVELIVTILKQRASGMSLDRIPIFVWSVLVMSFMVLFAMPPLMVAGLMLEMDRGFGTLFFHPAFGGDALLWQHLFWFFGHPDVYILMLPAFGILTSVVVVAAGRPLVGYPAAVLSLVAIGFLSFGLWVHHMFATGLPMLGMSFFSAASMMIAIPSGVLVFCWIGTIWNGAVRLTPAFLFAVGSIATFVLGGVTGVMLASVPFDLQVHDTFFVVAHFHYVLFGGVVFPLFAGFHHWFPKVTGRSLSEPAGKLGFWTIFLGFHLTFFPQHVLGLMGMPRRVFTYLPELGWGELNLLSTVGAFVLGFGILIFVVNAMTSAAVGATAGSDPWGGDSLEWSTSSPPPNYNFHPLPAVASRYPMWTEGGLGAVAVVPDEGARRETPTTTAVDAAAEDRLVLPGPTLVPLFAAASLAVSFFGIFLNAWLIPIGGALTVGCLVAWTRPGERGADLEGRRSPVWWAMLLLVAIEITIFATLLSSYFYLRFNAATWPPPDLRLPGAAIPLGAVLLALGSGVAIMAAKRAAERNDAHRLHVRLAVGLGLLAAFMLAILTATMGLEPRHDSHAYGSIVWVALLALALHAVVAALMGSVLLAHSRGGRLSDRQRILGAQLVNLFWQLVVVAAVPLVALLLLAPGWLRA